MRKREHQGIIYGFVLVALLTGGLTGCSKTGTTVTNAAVTYVSVMNMAPYAPAMDIFLNGKLSSAAGGIPPGKVSQQYSPLAPGNYDVLFKKTGVDSVLAEIPSSLYDTTQFSTLILYNLTGSPAAHALRITDDFSTVSNYNTNYRFFNLAPDAPRVDLYIGGTVAQPARINADNIGNPGFNSFQQVPAATYTLSAHLNGVTPDSVLTSFPGANLLAGGVYTIILTETKNGSANSYALNILQAAY
jgi:hypothetical protein